MDPKQNYQTLKRENRKLNTTLKLLDRQIHTIWSLENAGLKKTIPVTTNRPIRKLKVSYGKHSLSTLFSPPLQKGIWDFVRLKAILLIKRHPENPDQTNPVAPIIKGYKTVLEPASYHDYLKLWQTGKLKKDGCLYLAAKK